MDKYRRQGQRQPIASAEQRNSDGYPPTINMIPQLNKTEKEKCIGCNKFIWTHNQIIMTCKSYKIIVHAKCSKSLFEFNNISPQNTTNFSNCHMILIV